MQSTITSRFFVSFVSNLTRSGLNFLTVILLARWLGPADFGTMSFLLAAFTAVRGMLDMGSSQAFFTLLARRPRSRQFVSIFWKYIWIQLSVAVLLLLVVLPESVVKTLWADQSRWLLVLAFVAAFMQGTVWTLAVQMAEASRQTIRVQHINTAVTLLHLLVISSLALSGQLAIPFVFLALALEWGAASWMASRLYSTHTKNDPTLDVVLDTPRTVFREFFLYCLPLVPVTFLGFFHEFSDRWMLQTWGGKLEQGYFSIAQQYCAISLLATTSVLRILWKEIAEAHHQNKIDRVNQLYQRASRVLFFIGAFLAGGLQPIAGEILAFTVGAAYLGGTLTMAIILLYPVHQSIGQISGMMLLATGRTKAYAWCSSVSMITSLVAAYWVLAPESAAIPGLQLGAEGLALKLVGIQLFSVNLMGWVIARLFGWRFDWKYQIFSLLGCISLGWIAHGISGLVLGWGVPLIGQLLLMALIYIGLVGAYLYCLPWLLLMTRPDLIGFLKRFRQIVSFN